MAEFVETGGESGSFQLTVYVCVCVWLGVDVCVWELAYMYCIILLKNCCGRVKGDTLTVSVYNTSFPYNAFCHIHKITFPKTSQFAESITEQLPISSDNKPYTMKTHILSTELQKLCKESSPASLDTHCLSLCKYFQETSGKFTFAIV